MTSKESKNMLDLTYQTMGNDDNRASLLRAISMPKVKFLDIDSKSNASYNAKQSMEQAYASDPSWLRSAPTKQSLEKKLHELDEAFDPKYGIKFELLIDKESTSPIEIWSHNDTSVIQRCWDKIKEKCAANGINIDFIPDYYQGYSIDDYGKEDFLSLVNGTKKQSKLKRRIIFANESRIENIRELFMVFPFTIKASVENVPYNVPLPIEDINEEHGIYNKYFKYLNEHFKRLIPLGEYRSECLTQFVLDEVRQSPDTTLDWAYEHKIRFAGNLHGIEIWAGDMQAIDVQNKLC
jgi:hypothetical protein